MFRDTCVVTSLLVFCCNIALAYPGASPLGQGSLGSLQQEALRSNKPFVVYFSSETARECKRMLRSTWADKALLAYLDRYYLSSEVDASSQQAVAAQYRVMSCPTLIIFSPEGRMMGRVEGYVTAGTLQEILRKHVSRLIRKQPIKPLRGLPQSDAPLLASSDWRPQAARVAPSDDRQWQLQVPGMEAYSLAQMQPRGAGTLGLLVGMHTNLKHLNRQVRQIEHFWRGPIWVYAEEQASETVYHLVLGAYEQEQKAHFFANMLAQVNGVSSTITPLPAR
ncbi:MAG: hypothetical protein OHK0039_27080 [Bacteroidia bacterium]